MDYMAQALTLARLALGEVSPNPAVGALVVNNGEIIGQGYTQPPGSDHAEIVALKQAGIRARGSTMYVTLEPCCHFGRTPPCSRAIIEAGIRCVHIAALDANPEVSGRGKKELEEAGIKLHLGEHGAEAARINEAYNKFITRGIPFVTAKFAMSLDGKIATRSGDSQWITGEESRKRAHQLRYVNDVVIVGVNTVIMDNPRLTVRCSSTGGTSRKQPLRVVVDSKGNTPPDARIFSEPGRTIIAMGSRVQQRNREIFTDVGAELMEIPASEGRIDLKKLLELLGEKKVTSVMVEGGGKLLGSFFERNLVDKVIAFIAPIIIGGQDARTAVAGRGFETVAESLKLDDTDIESIGEDFVISGYVNN